MKKGTNAQDKIIGSNLRRWRFERKLTQQDLAAALDLTFQQIQKYEKGTNRISGSRINQLCKILETTPSQILGTPRLDNPSDDAIATLGETREGLELAHAFNRIDDLRHRKLVLEVASAFATPPTMTGIKSALKVGHTAQQSAAGT